MPSIGCLVAFAAHTMHEIIISFFIMYLVLFAMTGFAAARLGRDSEYLGGEWRRKIDKAWAKTGVAEGTRHVCHGVEHVGRAASALMGGDVPRAGAEIQRARQHFKQVPDPYGSRSIYE